MKKEFGILIGLSVIYIIISFVLNFLNGSDKVVYLGDYTKVKINGDSLSIDKSNNKISNTKVKYYFNEDIYTGYLYTKKGEYDSDYQREVLSNSGKIVKFSNGLIASTKSVSLAVSEPISIIATEVDRETARNFVSHFPDKGELQEVSKYSVDLDNNGTKEEIYNLKLVDEEENYTTIIAFKSGDNMEVVDTTTNTGDSDSFRFISLYKYIDFNEDGIYEVVIKENNGDDMPIYYNVYTYEDNSLVSVEEE